MQKYEPVTDSETFNLKIVSQQDLEKSDIEGSFKKPTWVRGIELCLICIIPILFIFFVLHEVKIWNNDLADRTQFDITKNYTINIEYWRNEEDNKDRHYYLELTRKEDISPDGVVRNLTLINNRYPGPLLEAKAGDTLHIHVKNLIDDQPTTIHCHGLLYNKENNFYDGASNINQCPIPPGSTYTYKIELDENQWGTYWYHSHYGSQYADGAFGPLVIHSRKEDEILKDVKYDADIVVLVNDYYHNESAEYLTEYLSSGNENSEPIPDNGVINGANQYIIDKTPFLFPRTSLIDDGTSHSPARIPAINLDPSKTYRIRLINAGFFTPYSFSIDEHKMNIIEADGSNVETLEVNSIEMSVGQRYSFILERQNFESNNFWMRAMFNSFCFSEANKNFDTNVKCALSYSNLSPSENSNLLSNITSVGIAYDGGDVRCRDMDQKQFKSLSEVVPKINDTSNRPDRIVQLDVAFMIGARQIDRGYFNDMTWKPLPIGENTLRNIAFQNSSSGNKILRTANDTEFETKQMDQYILNFDNRNEIVDIVINNYDDGSHPFHLHGYKFWVVGSNDRGYFHEDFYEDDKLGVMNFENALRRDTVNVSGFGWVVIRMVVDNPGIWPLHCHIGWHMESGLLLQINALQHEYTSWAHYPSSWANLCAN